MEFESRYLSRFYAIIFGIIISLHSIVYDTYNLYINIKIISYTISCTAI